jgi:hypothetical protein
MYMTFVVHLAKVSTCNTVYRYVGWGLEGGIRDIEGVFVPADFSRFDTDIDIVKVL